MNNVGFWIATACIPIFGFLVWLRRDLKRREDVEREFDTRRAHLQARIAELDRTKPDWRSPR